MVFQVSSKAPQNTDTWCSIVHQSFSAIVSPLSAQVVYARRSGGLCEWIT